MEIKLNNYNDHDDYNSRNAYIPAPAAADVSPVEGLWPVNADEDYDGLPPIDWEPPTREQVELESNADFIGGQFRNIASRPWNPWDTIGHFGLSLLRLARKRQPERLPARRRDKLLSDLLTARFALLEQFAGCPEQPMLAAAMDGAFTIGNHLGETDQERAARHPHVMLDAIDRFQIAVNTARSICLEEDIRGRADKRIIDEVSAMVASALEAAA